MTAIETHWMDTLTHDDLRILIDQPAGSSVSLFLPIQRATPERHQNSLRLENLLRRAEARLNERGAAPAAQELLAPAWPLIGDQRFWEHQCAGLAIFAAAGLFRTYRLSVAFEELLVVDDRLHITPLLPLLSGDGTYYLLALDLDGVRLFECTHYTMHPITLAGIPRSLEDALKYDEFAKQAQWHPGVPGHGGARGPIYHGQGARDERAAKEEILRYFQQVDHGVCAAMRAERAPLVLAGVDYLLPLYRAASSYPHLAEAGIPINPDDLRPEDLHARAWAAVAPRFDQSHAAIERYRHLAGTQPALAPSELRPVLLAAAEARVATLFVGQGQRRWGRFDPLSGELALHDPARPRDSELLNLAAIQTIQHGGAVYAVTPKEMAEAMPLAAILRY